MEEAFEEALELEEEREYIDDEGDMVMVVMVVVMMVMMVVVILWCSVDDELMANGFLLQ